MRNIPVIISASALLITVCIANPLKAQTVQKVADQSKPIPENVAKIMERSCVGCHSEDGNKLAMMKLNFTKWNEYSSGDQASTATDICKQVTKNKMPPKKILKIHPEVILSDGEKSIICTWATGISADK